MVFPDEISARISDVHEELTRLIKHLDEFPAPAAIKRVNGTSASVAAPFGTRLKQLAQTASASATAMMEELSSMDLAVRAALEDLATQDEELATTAERLESFLDSSATYGKPAVQGGAAASADTGGDAWGAKG